MKSFSLNKAKWLIAPLITVAIIGVMWFYYAVIYLPHRVEYLSGRNLRILATIGKEITSTTENYNTVLLKNTVLRKTRPTDGPTPGEGEEHKKPPKGRKHEFPKYRIEHSFDRVETGFDWVATYVPDPHLGHPLKHPVNFSQRDFDIVLVVDHEGQVLFHHAPAGIQIRGLDQLAGSASVSSKNDKGKTKKSQEADFKENAIPKVTEVREVMVAGQAYTLFLLPVEVPVKLESEDPRSLNDKERWVIAGLVQKSKFLSECKSISSTVRSVVLSLMMVMLVSIPLMRMFTLGPRERVRPLTIVMLVSSLLMGTALVTLFLADMFVYTSAETRLNGQAKKLADQIAKNVSTEIQQAYLQLSILTKLAEGELQQAVHQNQVEQKKGDILTRKDVFTGPYPFLNMAFWVDSMGDQRGKWTIQQKPNPFINLSDREYFKHAKDNRLLTMPFERKDEPHDARLWVEPVYSWATAEHVTVLAMPLSDAVPEDAVPKFKPRVAALETKFLSLANPVLPKGFGYAVIDENGLVLFHSYQQRNLRGSSFIEETDNDLTIQAALAGHMNEEGDGVFWGKDQHFVVKPLEPVPWTLVVFRDKERLRTAGTEGLATATILLLLYTLLLSALVTAGWLLCRLNKSSSGYRATWLWPHPDKQLAYRYIIAFNLGMSLVLAWFILWGHGWKTVAVGAGIPLLAVGFAVVQWTRRRKSTPPVVNASRGLYQLTAVSFVLVLSFFPAVAFFKVAYDVEHELFLKDGQLSLATKLIKREQRVRKDYQSRGINLLKGHEEEFFERRLKTDSDKETLDVYGQFFAETKTEYVDKVPPFEAESSWSEQQFFKLIEAIRIPFNEVAIKSAGLIRNASSDGTRTWVPGSDTRLDLYFKSLEQTPIAKPVIRLSSQMSAPLEKNVVFPVAVAIAFVGWSVYFVIGRIGQTLFGSRLIPVSEYKAVQGRNGDPLGNVLVLGPSVPNQMRLGSYHLIDFDTVMVDDTWIDPVRADIAKARGASIALLNWDRHIESPSRNQQKLLLLRELLTEGRTVLIQSRIDPTHFDLAGDLDTNSEQAWMHALRSFSRWYPEDDRGDVAEFEKSLGHREAQALQHLSGDSQKETRQAQAAIKASGQVIREECRSSVCLQAIGSEVAGHLDLARVTGGEVLETISRVTQSYYQRLWATCSWGEQYVLYALARDGFVCCTQLEVQHLVRRGLIERKSMLGPFNATFRAWILDECRDPTYAQAWEKSKPQQTWAKARHIVVALLAALGVFLYVTQQEQVGHLMEFGTALFAGIPIIGEWLGQLTGKKTPTAEKI